MILKYLKRFQYSLFVVLIHWYQLRFLLSLLSDSSSRTPQMHTEHIPKMVLNIDICQDIVSKFQEFQYHDNISCYSALSVRVLLLVS